MWQNCHSYTIFYRKQTVVNILIKILTCFSGNHRKVIQIVDVEYERKHTNNMELEFITTKIV